MEVEQVIRGAFSRHREVFDSTLGSAMSGIVRAGEMIEKALAGNGTLYACGNGGSAADAQHFVAEFVCKYVKDKKPLPAHALSTDTSVLTAIGNDFGFEEIFARQILALGKPGDMLVAFTTSGTSKNVLRALEVAREKKMQTIVLTGTGGAGLIGRADCVIAVHSTETARIQEVHGLICHAWCEYIDTSIT